MERVELGGAEKAFTRGGNRLCFIDPRDSSRCIKVLRPDRSPEIRRRQKGFPKNLRPINSFDENLQELKIWQSIETDIGEPAFKLITRCYGFVDTNHGPGLVMDLVRDADQMISKTLKQYLWEGGLTNSVKTALEIFSEDWAKLAIPSKKLLLHNMLIQKSEAEKFSVFVIDGLGWSSVVPLAKYSRLIAKKRAKQKIEELWLSVDNLLIKKQQGQDFGYHGWINDDKRVTTFHGQ